MAGFVISKWIQEEFSSWSSFTAPFAFKTSSHLENYRVGVAENVKPLRKAFLEGPVAWSCWVLQHTRQGSRLFSRESRTGEAQLPGRAFLCSIPKHLRGSGFAQACSRPFWWQGGKAKKKSPSWIGGGETRKIQDPAGDMKNRIKRVPPLTLFLDLLPGRICTICLINSALERFQPTCGLVQETHLEWFSFITW